MGYKGSFGPIFSEETEIITAMTTATMAAMAPNESNRNAKLPPHEASSPSPAHQGVSLSLYDLGGLMVGSEVPRVVISHN